MLSPTAKPAWAERDGWNWWAMPPLIGMALTRGQPIRATKRRVTKTFILSKFVRRFLLEDVCQ